MNLISFFKTHQTGTTIALFVAALLLWALMELI